MGQIFITVGTAGNSSINEYSLGGAKIKAPLISDAAFEPHLVVAGSNLYEGDFDNQIIKDATDGEFVAGVNTTSEIGGIAVSGSELFASNYNSGSISEYSSGLTLQSQNFITNLGEPTAMTVSNGDIFVIDSETEAVDQYEVNGTLIKTSLLSSIGECADIAVDGNDIFLSNSPDGNIEEYTTSGNLVSKTFITGLSGPDGLAILGDDLYIAANGTGVIDEYTLSGTPVATPLISGLNNPVYLAVLPEPSAIGIMTMAAICLAHRRCARKFD